MRRAALILAAAMVGFLMQCCGSTPVLIPTPTISSLAPDGAIAGGGSFVLTLSGTGFETDSQVFWNGSCITNTPPSTTCATVTYNASTTQLSVTVPAAYIAKPGFPQITVVNPSPGGPSTYAATFTITQANNPAPTVTSLSPSNTPTGVLPANNMITVNGTNFIASSTVSFNGNPRATQFVSAMQLTATVLASDVANAGSISVEVSNPQPGGGVSTPASFTVGPVSNTIKQRQAFSGAQASAELISLSNAGGPANGMSSTSSISADGRFVAFYSAATNLATSGASGSIFVRDTCLNVQNCTPQTTAVDLDVSGNSPNVPASQQFGLSADGRFIAFSSAGENLATDAGSANPGAKIYVRDLCEGVDAPAGCTPHTEIASINSHDAPTSGNFAAIGNDGRFIAFASTDAPELYVRDTCTGTTATSACETATAGLNLNGAISQSGQPLAMSSDGRYVAIVVSIPIVNQQPQSAIFLVDTCEGIDAPTDCLPKTTDISIAPDGSAFAGNSEVPAMSGDGRFVAFQVASAAPDADSGTNPTQVFLRDTCSGATAPNGCVPSTTLISSAASSPSISSSGRYVSYVGTNPNTGVSGTSETFLPFVYDTCFGSVTPCTSSAYLAASVSVQTGIVIPVSSDGSLAAIASKDALGMLPSSGLGDVYAVPISH